MKEGTSKVFKHNTGNTLYFVIPADIATDSVNLIKAGDKIRVILQDDKSFLIRKVK